jgi:hypothetical protein
MPPCTICGIHLHATEETCRWCLNTNLADAEGRSLPQPWWMEARLPLAPRREGLRAMDGGRTGEAREPIGRLAGLGYTLLGWLCLGYAVAHFFVWTFPRCAWLHYTGRLPLTDARTWTDTHKEGRA